MNRDRLHHVLDRLAANAGDPEVSVGDALCATALEVVRVDGAGLSIHIGDLPPYSIGVAGSDMVAIHELERTLGEGPCIDAFRNRVPVAEPDLNDLGVQQWPAFSPEALRTSARAAFGYPLLIADECFGALNLYTTTAGPLAEGQHEDALLIADISTHAVVTSLTLEPDSAAALEFEDVIRNQDVVHQATGMVSVQLSLPIVDSLARLRARAFADGRPLSDVARDIVNRQLRLEE